MMHKIQINSGYNDAVNTAVRNLGDVVQDAKEKDIYEKSITMRSIDAVVDHVQHLRNALDIAIAVVDMFHNGAFNAADMAMGIEAFNTACIKAKVSRLESGKN